MADLPNCWVFRGFYSYIWVVKYSERLIHMFCNLQVWVLNMDFWKSSLFLQRYTYICMNIHGKFWFRMEGTFLKATVMCSKIISVRHLRYKNGLCLGCVQERGFPVLSPLCSYMCLLQAVLNFFGTICIAVCRNRSKKGQIY